MWELKKDVYDFGMDIKNKILNGSMLVHLRIVTGSNRKSEVVDLSAVSAVGSTNLNCY